MAYVYGNLVREDILRMIPPDGHVIGSIGCGFGTTEAELVRGGREVHGVDMSAEAIRVASTRLTSARVIAPAELNHFQPSSLDGLILADVIEHIPSAWLALAEFSRAVKPGGWVVISVPNMRNIRVAKTFIFGGDWPEHPTGIFDATHVQVITRKRIERWCQKAHLRIDEWFDRYEPANATLRVISPILDTLTFRLFHEWFMFQWQLRCRVSGNSLSNPGSI